MPLHGSSSLATTHQARQSTVGPGWWKIRHRGNRLLQLIKSAMNPGKTLHGDKKPSTPTNISFSKVGVSERNRANVPATRPTSTTTGVDCPSNSGVPENRLPARSPAAPRRARIKPTVVPGDPFFVPKLDPSVPKTAWDMVQEIRAKATVEARAAGSAGREEPTEPGG
ncbi:hypothetical protein BV898_05788 [Hypsibius exemplaris]|uniref:Uncharacterized protein n=1 Tax=Hypsibius exemplaris TaxID=2072580 RepID=A0A1W0WYM3_HYPEX|nr:hypothetical protein BV898_05788 [Hypsibius exemplaris]